MQSLSDVVDADVARTRQDERLFRDARVREALAQLLTRFCVARGVGYRQGLNEVLAPIVGAHLREAEAALGAPALGRRAVGRCYACLCAFAETYAPLLATDDDDSEALQLCCRIFGLLLRYHAPDVGRCLDQADVAPELFVTPWVLTVGARGLKLDGALELWRRYLVDGDAALNVYAALSLVLAAAETIKAADAASVPEVLCGVLAGEAVDAAALVDDASRLRADTPESLRRLLVDACFKGGTARRRDAAVLARTRSVLSSWSCVGIAPDDVAASLLFSPRRAVDEAPPIKYVLLDCRPEGDFAKSRVATSYHVDPAQLDDPDALEAFLASVVEPLRAERAHVAVVGRAGPREALPKPPLSSVFQSPKASIRRVGVDATELGAASNCHASSWDQQTGDSEDPDVARLALLLLQRDIRHVGHVRGGFAALARALGPSHADVIVAAADAAETPTARPRSLSASSSASDVGNYLRRLSLSLARATSASPQDDDDAASWSEPEITL